MIARTIAMLRATGRSDFVLVGFAMAALVAAQLMLSRAFPGTNFGGGDGKMIQAVILAAQKFGGVLQFNNINPIEGLGSQLLPVNVWLNPVYWPFAFVDKAVAANIAAAVALCIFVLACYTMSRCFDVPVLPSIVAAQSTVVLFAPMLFPLKFWTVFTLMVGNAVVYAPYMVALGLVARLEHRSARDFALTTGAIFTLVLYSICCDPLWSTINGISWALPFAIVALCAGRVRDSLLRCAALGCCLIVLLLCGVGEYLYSLATYTSRVQFPTLSDRLRGPDFLASALFYSPFIKYFYLAWLLGWTIGLVTLRGRARVLALAGLSTCVALFAVMVVYLLLQNASWSAPLPMYMEQALFSLFTISAAAGYWGGLQALGTLPLAQDIKRRCDAAWSSAWIAGSRRLTLWQRSSDGPPSPRASLSRVAVFAGAAIVPILVAAFAIGRPAHKADLYYERWPEEPELAGYLVDRTVHGPGGVFRGSSLFWKSDYGIQLTLANLWVRGVPSTSEYSQLITPQSTYFASKVLNNDVRDLLNLFLPRVEASSATSLKILPMLGTRYYIVSDQSDPVATRLDALARAAGSPSVSVPQGVHHRADKGARWNVYELPQPNLGNYSPTEVTTAESGAAAAALMNAAEFDFTRQAVLSAPLQKALTPARNMRMSFVRGGLHLSGRSDGTSLVVLPQQFTHCLRARDRRVRLVRANIMLTGVIFEGSIDTDILFDYGVFTPRCRRADLADIKALELHIDTPASRPSGGRLFPSAGDAIAKLWVAFSALK